MRANPVDLIGGFYTSDSLPWSCQDTVNWLPVMAEVAGTRTVSMFATPPGLKPYQQIGTGPIRGMHDCEGLRLIVSGRYLFRISNGGVGIPIGLIPGVGRVQMTHNQFKTGYQVLIENGQGGGGYVYTTSTDTFAKITDEGYPGSISSDHLDSYILGVEPQGRFWFHSNLADATDYNTLDRYEAEAAPDRIVGLAVSQFEVVVFGQRTIDFFFNAGGQTGTFQNRRQSITRGCASRHTIQKLDNTLFWLGDDGVVYRMEGYAARPISTRALEKAITGFNWSEAIAFTWEDRGHKVYYLTLPDGQTFGYDVITGLWHRRESYGLSRWRLSHTQKWGREWFGGDFQDGRLWELDWDYFLEGDQPIISERTSGVVADNQSAVLLPNAELVLDTGHGPATTPIAFPSQPPPPSITGTPPAGQIMVPYSYQFTVTGEFPPFAVTDPAGTLPSGLSISTSGLLSGTPGEGFNGQITLRVTDARGLFADQQFPLHIQGLAHWNAADKSTSTALSDDDRLAEVVIDNVVTGGGGVRAVQARNSGRWYVEFELTRKTAQYATYFGLITGSAPINTNPASQAANCLGMRGTNNFNVGLANSSDGATPVAGDRLGVAIDFDARRCWLHVQGVWKFDQSPTTAPGGLVNAETPAGPLYPNFFSEDDSNALSNKARLFVEGSQMSFRPSGFQPWGGM
ncbi:hypothetical protein CEE55_18140 [Stenotrophomonas pavanii]|uniref:Uncharacterized protein n=1 Tax=Stenotrophomonas pavanii TaxID=487698 RepID=A0A246KUK5_9GAMM|nr:putative Ig domain-containing protein [Stenotrophomonas pavanii]OWR28952.1 hypothetical protein CEE55_18140 [Stenotrophomonas pavanii]